MTNDTANTEFLMSNWDCQPKVNENLFAMIGSTWTAVVFPKNKLCSIVSFFFLGSLWRSTTKLPIIDLYITKLNCSRQLNKWFWFIRISFPQEANVQIMKLWWNIMVPSSLSSWWIPDNNFINSYNFFLIMLFHQGNYNPDKSKSYTAEPGLSDIKFKVCTNLER